MTGEYRLYRHDDDLYAVRYVDGEPTGVALVIDGLTPELFEFSTDPEAIAITLTYEAEAPCQ